MPKPRPCPPVPNGNRDRGLGEGEVSSFYCFARPRRPPQQTSACRPGPTDCALRWERIGPGLSLGSGKGATDKDQGGCKLECFCTAGVQQLWDWFGLPLRLLGPSFWKEEVNVLLVWKVFVLQRSAKIVFCIFLKGEPGPRPKAAAGVSCLLLPGLCIPSLP